LGVRYPVHGQIPGTVLPGVGIALNDGHSTTMSQEHPSADSPSIMASVQDAIARSRRAAAKMGVSEEEVAAVEDEVADMFERLAGSGGPRAAHHRAVAARARRHAQAARLVAELEHGTATRGDGAAQPPQSPPP
jgi:hypothetical protein